MAAAFRLIETGPAGGFLNMAIDEALAVSFQAEGHKQYDGFLRFYSWSGTWLSCGYFQEVRGLLDEAVMRREGISCVRRLSGGGLVLHGEEITYSLMCFDHILSTRSVKEAYFQITSFVRDALRQLGWEAEFARDAFCQARPGFSCVCAWAKEGYDIVVEGKKIGGHAQRRRKHFIFQQGFIPLRPPRLPLRRLVAAGGAEGEEGAAGFVRAERACLQSALEECFMRCLGRPLHRRPLAKKEAAAAAELAQNKYSSYAWNYLRGR